MLGVQSNWRLAVSTLSYQVDYGDQLLCGKCSFIASDSVVQVNVYHYEFNFCAMCVAGRLCRKRSRLQAVVPPVSG